MEKEEIKKIIEGALNQTNVLAEIKGLKKDVADLKETIDGWKMGGKVAFGSLILIGGFITWILNTLGIHISIK